MTPSLRPVWAIDHARHLLLDHAGRTVARVIHHNPLESPASIDPALGGVAIYSGWIPNENEGDGRTEPYPSSPRTWLGGGKAGFEDWINTLVPKLTDAGTLAYLRPVATHVVSDIPSIRTAMDLGEPLRFILNPALLLTHTMLRDADDHLARFGEALGHHPKLAAVELFDVRLTGDDLGTGLVRADAGDGAIGEKDLAAWLDRWIPETVPIIRAV